MRVTYKTYLNSISKNDIIEIYFNQNKTISEVCDYFNITQAIFIQLLRYYNLHKPKNLHTQNIKKSKLEKYGDANYNNQAQRAETNIQKYGVDNQFKRVDMMETIRKQNEEKYGSKNNIYKNIQTRINNSGSIEASYKNQIIKTRQTVLEKYGVDWAAKSELVKNNIRESLKETFNEKYSCDNYWVSEDAKRSNGSKNSHANLDFEQLLINNNILYEKEFLLQNRYYDFKVNNFLIEINPTATHNSTWSPWCKDQGLDKHYHADKTDLASNNGYRCIHIWDWDNPQKIINTFLKQKDLIGARECIVKEVDVKNQEEFLTNNHFQGYTKCKIALGLFYKDELIMLMTFGTPRYSKKYEWELIRLCSSKKVTGGAQKLFKYFISNYQPKSIVSYCDLSKFEGNVYLELGFKKSGRVISKHWYNIKLKDHITDKLLYKRGFDKLLGNIFGKYGVGTDNAELMLQHGFVEIYDCGQSTYVWNALNSL